MCVVHWYLFARLTNFVIGEQTHPTKVIVYKWATFTKQNLIFGLIWVLWEKNTKFLHIWGVNLYTWNMGLPVETLTIYFITWLIYRNFAAHKKTRSRVRSCLFLWHERIVFTLLEASKGDVFYTAKFKLVKISSFKCKMLQYLIWMFCCHLNSLRQCLYTFENGYFLPYQVLPWYKKRLHIRHHSTF